MDRVDLKMKVISNVANEFAKLSTCSSRSAVGAVLYDDNFRIVATGYNGAPQGLAHCNAVGCTYDKSGSCISAVHAEVNAILQCAVYGISTQGLNLYTTYSPCDRCAVLIVRAGIQSVTYGRLYHNDNIASHVFASAGILYEHFRSEAQQ